MGANHYDFGFKLKLLIRFSPTVSHFKYKENTYLMDPKTKKVIRWRNMAVTIVFLMVLLLGEAVWPDLSFMWVILLALLAAIVMAVIMVLTITDSALDGLTMLKKDKLDQNMK